MEDTLWALLHPSHVIQDTAEMDLVQGLAKHLETGIKGHQIATKVMK